MKGKFTENSNRKKMQIKASYTVEASLIFPLICLILCGIITLTLELYYQVEYFSIEKQERVEKKAEATSWIRIEAVVEYLIQEE